MIELCRARTRNNKTFALDDGRMGVVCSIGAVHYWEDNQWKDIDPTIVNGKVTKAPYDLTIDFTNKGFHVKSKLDGSELTLKLKGVLNVVEPEVVGNKVIWRDLLPDTDVVIEAQRDRVSLRRILKSDKAKPDVEFEIIEKGAPHLRYRAIDRDGEPLDFTAQKTIGKLTESIDLAGKKFPIEIDPTWQVGATTDDCLVLWNGSEWVFSHTVHICAGYVGATTFKQGGGMRFTNITIPSGSTIDSAKLTFTCKIAYANVVVNSVIIGEDVDDAATFSDIANYQGRRGTIVGGANDNNITDASVLFNAIAAWTANAEYDSPEIKTIIQEIIDRGGWASGQAMALFWDDHGGNSTAVALTRRSAYTYGGDSAKAVKLVITSSPPITPKTSSDTGSGEDVKASGNPLAIYSRSETGSGLDALVALVTPASIMGRKTAFDGYRCFIEQYVENKMAGSLPLKLPDGTKW